MESSRLTTEPTFANLFVVIPILKFMEILFQLPPMLLVALCSSESDFRSVVNHRDGGAPSHGVCQVKEATAQFLGYSGDSVGLLNPVTNSFYAAKYLSHQINRYQSIEKGVASYNAGSVPGEIRNKKYVKRVFGRWGQFKANSCYRKRRNSGNSGNSSAGPNALVVFDDVPHTKRQNPLSSVASISYQLGGAL